MSVIAANVAELVDALDLGSSGETRGGSSPSIRTNHKERTLTNSPSPAKAGGEVEPSRRDLTSFRAAERAHTILLRPGGNWGEGLQPWHDG